MVINQVQFSAFNSIVAGVATYYNTSNADVASINSFLSTFARDNQNNANSICTDPTCDCLAGITGSNCDQVSSASTASVSVISVLVAAFFAVLAMRQ